MKQKVVKLKKLLKFAVVVICLTGFLLQTYEFLELYWTYPTVVDIQVSVPSEIELPAISFCSTNGINPEFICQQPEFCINSDLFRRANFCETFTEVCQMNGEAESDFQAVLYDKYVRHSDLNASTLQQLRRPVDEFLNCKIKSAGRIRDCDLSDTLLGSYYSDTNIFNFCYTINSLWSNPDRKIIKIKKSERIEMVFYTDISDRMKDLSQQYIQFPKFNYPSNPGVQIAFHSPYLSLSPFIAGSGFLAGKRYMVNIDQEETHLLPSPYQTNCTDYMELWRARGGIGPLNQMMVVEECIYNRTLEENGCVPFSIDYPHNNTVCKFCEDCNGLSKIRDECTKQLRNYNQPCDFIAYETHSEEGLVTTEKKFASRYLNINEKIIMKKKGHDCGGENIWARQCQTVTIEIGFDDFQITNLTYNAKFESIELFSVIGGYLGMYLGVSIVAMYDFAELGARTLYQFLKKKRAVMKKDKAEKRKAQKAYRRSIRYSGVRSDLFRTIY